VATVLASRTNERTVATRRDPVLIAADLIDSALTVAGC